MGQTRIISDVPKEETISDIIIDTSQPSRIEFIREAEDIKS